MKRSLTKSLRCLGVWLVCVAGCDSKVAQHEDVAQTEQALSIGLKDTDPAVVTVTPLAVSKFQEFLTDSPESHIRLSVTEGGCTGFLYGLDVEDAPIDESSRIDRSNGFTLVVAPEHVICLEGATIDWEVLPDGTAGFRFDNPNAAESCPE